MKKLHDILEYCSKATPGPWLAVGDLIRVWQYDNNGKKISPAIASIPYGIDEYILCDDILANRDFISGARSDLPAVTEALLVAVGTLHDFQDYFDPKGGISDVPLGPFERMEEALTQIKRLVGEEMLKN